MRERICDSNFLKHFIHFRHSFIHQFGRNAFVECFPAESPGLAAQVHPGNSPSESRVQGVAKRQP